MRYGFTTGSCAAAAAKAAAYMLLTGKKKTQITIQTPKGISFHAEILDISRQERMVRCAVRKDGGDDPDVTTGALVYATVTLKDEEEEYIASKEKIADSQVSEERKFEKPKKTSGSNGTKEAEIEEKWQEGSGGKSCGRGQKEALVGKSTADEDKPQIWIDGGIGVGRVTKPGLDQPVGNAAINHVPREMITKEVEEVCRLADYKGGLFVEISVPGGEELAQKTFNPRLGILGGISILGTTGIVEPMSNQAILDTIRVELNQRRVAGYDYVAISPGNYGLDFLKAAYGYDLDRSVKCSNFIGQTMDMAVELGFKRVLLTGHIGKLIKVAGGIMNTHSREADCRMELLAAFAVRFQVPKERIQEMLECVTTEEAVRILKECGKEREVMDYAMERICYYLDKRVKGQLQIACCMYSNEFGELAKSKEAAEWFTLLVQEQEQRI